MSKHQDRLRKLIQKAGGIVEGNFVFQPGVEILMKTEITPQASEIFSEMNIDTSRPDYEQAGEFASRVTYMSFKDEPGDAEEYNRKMIEEYGHLSVHSCHNVTFLIAGVSVETCLELVAHSEASVARLTSSRTKAQDHPLYRIQPDSSLEDFQINYLRELTSQSSTDNKVEDLSKDDREILNRMNPGAKVTALTYTMRVKDFHKTFIGRLSHHGVEREMREVCEMMCNQLHELYPLIVKTPDEYYAMNNNVKYSIDD